MRFTRWLYRGTFQISIIIISHLLFIAFEILFRNTSKLNLPTPLNLEFDDYPMITSEILEIARVNGGLYWTSSRRSTWDNCVSRISVSRKKDGHGGSARREGGRRTYLREMTLSSTRMEERRYPVFFLDGPAVVSRGIIHVPFLRASRANRGTKTICTRQSVAKHYL